MKSVIALLLGLSASVCFAEDTDGEQFSWDSSDTNSERSYDGVVIQVYKADGESPMVTLGTSLDGHSSTYCLNFVRTFEAVGYDTTATTTTNTAVAAVEVAGSSVSLADANCTVSEVTSSSFKIGCNDINGGALNLNFVFVDSSTSSTGNDGVEYTIELEGYTWVSADASAQFVLVQSVADCSSDYEYSADSEDEEEDDETDETDEVDDRRRLLEDDETDTEEDDATTDDDSAEESAGISSDDSNEYDSGFAQFVVSGQAQDQCPEGNTNITSNLVENTDAEQLHIVFEHFSCNLFIDPEYLVDPTKINGVGAVSIFMAAVTGLIALLF